jgi:hypothetical protein
MHKTATIILNRNLPKVTDSLVDKILESDSEKTDIYVIEAGSDDNNLSKYTSWHVKEDDVIKNGLRYSRGMNYGLLELWKRKKWNEYDSFFLITNDTKFPDNQKTISILQDVLDTHPRIGICSPCSKNWGEQSLIGANSLKYFWFIHNNAYIMKREFIEQVLNADSPTYMNFLFDGTNFRGYLAESEIIAKSYVNDWAAAITTKAYAHEDESYLLNKNHVIKTESYEINMQLYIDEGLDWIKKKYGFNSRWQMIQYSKLMYDKFFDYFPEESPYKI